MHTPKLTPAMSERERERPKVAKEDVLAHISRPQSESSAKNDKKTNDNDLKPPKSMVLSGVKWKIDYKPNGK